MVEWHHTWCMSSLNSHKVWRRIFFFFFEKGRRIFFGVRLYVAHSVRSLAGKVNSKEDEPNLGRKGHVWYGYHVVPFLFFCFPFRTMQSLYLMGHYSSQVIYKVAGLRIFSRNVVKKLKLNKNLIKKKNLSILSYRKKNT